MMFTLVQLCASAVSGIREHVRESSLTPESVLEEFELTNETLRRLMADLNHQMDSGLRNGLEESSVAMLPSFVPTLPDGSERGKFVALDLGGTNLRVLLMDTDKSENSTESRNFKIPKPCMTGTDEQLFDFIADCLGTFTEEKGLSEVELPLGFTFSYPCDQTDLHSAILLRWTKGFSASGVVGEDVARILKNAIQRRGCMKISQISIINDAVGTLIASGAEHPNCVLGVIIATGTNSSYIEMTKNIAKLRRDFPYEHMIMDTEWGAFGDRGEIDYVKTPYDRVIDARSVHPGEYTFDKLIGGIYMGELVRLVLETLVKNSLIFAGRGSELMFTIGAFPTKFISEILSDKGGYMYNARQVLDELGVDGYTYSDLLLLREVCLVVSRRSAHLAAAAIACALNRIGEKKAAVAVDGSTFHFHPYFPSWVKEKALQLVNPGIEMSLVAAGDGSGKGAALVAAIADRLEKQINQN